jgi:hypothetical protein
MRRSSIVVGVAALLLVPVAGPGHTGAIAHPAVAGAASDEVPAAALAAFARYVELVEHRFDRQVAAGSFLDLYDAEPATLSEALARLRDGEPWIRSRRDDDAEGSAIRPDKSILHHWVGTSFVLGATLEQALALALDFDRYPDLFAPEVTDARILERRASDDLRVYMRYRKKKIITVTTDVVQEVRFGYPAVDRAFSIAWDTSSRQIDDAGKPNERPKDAGDGFLWRLHTSWRFLQADGGVYLENETVVLTRKPPFLLRLIAGPMIKDGPREGVEFALAAYRRALVQQP